MFLKQDHFYKIDNKVLEIDSILYPVNLYCYKH